ncbi:hypothetical protein HOU02_gp282 [Caulobacter phage CcrBL9]|uniref:Uncharacterized protein n=1 Tax=Caulobacter phage CcrBL9 TaxID=2283270 RepID=A0A385ECE0_9CAUD|nr:hypothetical protein HOU02_gp282 [Caulobacter phage CcrBL9]AXQ69443.1 hypothetical protein CcrBL9_gp419 [Caulobacter phage CcrBL9]
MEKPYNLGRYAARDDRPIDDNPFDLYSEDWAEWRDGWRDAIRDRKPYS